MHDLFDMDLELVSFIHVLPALNFFRKHEHEVSLTDSQLALSFNIVRNLTKGTLCCSLLTCIGCQVMSFLRPMNSFWYVSNLAFKDYKLSLTEFSLGFHKIKSIVYFVCQSVRPCFPKLESIRYATCDLVSFIATFFCRNHYVVGLVWQAHRVCLELQLTGGASEKVHLKWPGKECKSVEISGLDVGWGQVTLRTFLPLMLRGPLTFSLYPKVNNILTSSKSSISTLVYLR